MPASRVTDHVCEIRFRPNARMLDYRGQWARFVAEHMNMSEWLVRENRLDVFDKADTRRFFVGFRNCGLTIKDAPTETYFVDHATKFLKFVLEFDVMDKPLLVERLGVRLKSYRAFNGDFAALMDLYTKRILPITPAGMQALGGKLLDIGGAINMSDDVATYHTMSGPMPIEQAKSILNRDEAHEFPKTGVYMDCDYWVKPQKEMSVADITGTARRFAERAAQRVDALYTLVTGAD